VVGSVDGVELLFGPTLAPPGQSPAPKPPRFDGLELLFGSDQETARFAYGPAVRAHPDIIAEGRRQRHERAGYALVAALGFLALSAVGYVAAWVSGWVLSGFIDRTS
jgi:hypothetical protein